MHYRCTPAHCNVNSRYTTTHCCNTLLCNENERCDNARACVVRVHYASACSRRALADINTAPPDATMRYADPDRASAHSRVRACGWPNIPPSRKSASTRPSPSAWEAHERQTDGCSFTHGYTYSTIIRPRAAGVRSLRHM